MSTAGDDADDDLTEQTPWRTFEHAEANAKVPGARIALRRVDLFEMATALGIHHGGVGGRIVWDGAFWGSGGKATIRSSQDREAPGRAVVDTASNHGVIAYAGRAEDGATPSTLYGMKMIGNTVTNFGINGQSRSSGMSFTQSFVDGVIECNTITQGPDSLDISGIAVVGNAAIWIQIAPGVGCTDGDETVQLVFLHNTVVVDQGNAFTDDSGTPGVTVFNFVSPGTDPISRTPQRGPITHRPRQAAVEAARRSDSLGSGDCQERRPACSWWCCTASESRSQSAFDPQKM